MERYSLITVDGFYQCIRNPLARELMGRLALLRADGYGPDYPASYLPLDGADHICTHHLLVERAGPNAGRVLMGYREVSLARCTRYGVTFPLLKTCLDSRSPAHLRALEHTLDAATRSGQDVIYAASFTIPKALRGGAVSLLGRQLLAALHHHAAMTMPPAVRISAGVLRFKVNDFYRQVGYFPMRDAAGQDLAPLPKWSAGGELIQLLQQERVTPWCAQCHEQHAALMAGRIVISPPSNDNQYPPPGAEDGLRPRILN